MKKISTLFVLSTLLTITVFAKYDDPQLSISSFSTTGDLQVEVDGHRYYFDKDKSLIIRNLRPGYHSIKVSKEKRKGNNDNRWFNFGNRREVIYNSSVNLRSGYDFDISINKFGKVFTDEARIDQNNDWNDNNRDRDWDNDRDRNRDRDRDRDRDRNYDPNRDRDYDNNYNRVISNSDFNQAKETLRREIFENTRINLAKQIIDVNYFTANQVKEIVNLFTFENNKLDIAKYAYKKTTDKNNYYLINDVFTYSNSKDELARFIRDYR
jgi:hypothetical protein